MISHAELDRFFEHLVAAVQAKGGVCAITSGMACVQYGVAQATKDCDLLCAADSAGQLLNVLRATPLQRVACSYRGHVTPPLDQRWLRGGWTSHFHWESGEIAAYLDVFGVAPRASSEWMADGTGTLTGMHTVAEMKRTDRAKDWPFATALGVKLLEDGDPRGWLHIFDGATLREVFTRVPLGDSQVRQRPCLCAALAMTTHDWNWRSSGKPSFGRRWTDFAYRCTRRQSGSTSWRSRMIPRRICRTSTGSTRCA